MTNLPLLIACILLFSSFLLPNHFPPWVSWQNEVLAFAAALVLSWNWVLNTRRQASAALSLPWLALVPMGLAVLAGLQWAGGMLAFGGEAFIIFCYALLCSLCIGIGFAQGAALRTELAPPAVASFGERLAWTLMLAAMVSVLILLTQSLMLDAASVSWLTNSSAGNAMRPGAHLFQANHAATLMVLGMASAVYLHARGRLSKFSIAALLLLLGIGMATTQSRTSVLSLGALLLWWIWKQPQIAPRTPRWTGALMGSLIVAVFMAWRTLFNAVHMMGAGIEQVGIQSIRFATWPQLASATLDHPWLGWGINQTASAHNATADRYPPTGEAYAFSHNLILDMALWVGLPLAALLTLLTGVWVWRRARATQTPLAWYGLALALPVAVHSMLEYPFAYAYFLVPTMLGLGISEGALDGRSLRLPRKMAAAILLMSTAVLSWSVVEYVQAEEDFRVVRFETLRIGQNPVAYAPPEMRLLTQVGALLKVFRQEAAPHMSADDFTMLRAVALHYPTDAIKFRYVLALALNGKRAEAERQLAVIRAQHGEQSYTNACAALQTKLQAYKINWQPHCATELPPKK